MSPDVMLIQQPAVDFERFLALAHQALGYSPATAADNSRRVLSEAERFLSCLAALRDPKAPAGLLPSLLTHVSFSLLCAADERDLPDILECAAGMPFVKADTTMRGVQIAVITGTLAQWRDAVKTGSSGSVQPNARACFNKVYTMFVKHGLNVWGDLQVRPGHDQTFFLEDKRGR